MNAVVVAGLGRIATNIHNPDALTPTYERAAATGVNCWFVEAGVITRQSGRPMTEEDWATGTNTAMDDEPMPYRPTTRTGRPMTDTEITDLKASQPALRRGLAAASRLGNRPD